MKKWIKKKSKIVFDSPYMKVRKDVVELPDGKAKDWTYWDSPDSVMVVGMTAEKKLVMIRQYRYLVGDDVIEFPAGSLHPDEDIETGAKRELEEETGFEGESLEKLGAFYETYGQLNRKIHIFFAPNVSPTRQKLDRGSKGFEDIAVELVDFNRAVEMAINNEIVAFGSTVAVLLLRERLIKQE